MGAGVTRQEDQRDQPEAPARGWTPIPRWRFGLVRGCMMRRPPHPLVRRRKDRLPTDHRPPALYRLRRATGEAPPAGPDARDAKLARLEAVLFGADEPLTARRLAAVAELADAAEARRLIERLQCLY